MEAIKLSIRITPILQTVTLSELIHQRFAPKRADKEALPVNSWMGNHRQRMLKKRLTWPFQRWSHRLEYFFPNISMTHMQIDINKAHLPSCECALILRQVIVILLVGRNTFKSSIVHCFVSSNNCYFKVVQALWEVIWILICETVKSEQLFVL